MDPAIRARLQVLLRDQQARGLHPGPSAGRNLVKNAVAGLYQHDDDVSGNEVRLVLVQAMVIAYREARKKDPEMAAWLLRSYLEDHPDAPGSRVFEKCDGLIEAAQVLKGVTGSSDRRALFLATKEVQRAAGEFIPLLMAWLAVLWQVQLGDVPDLKLVKAQTPAGTRVKRFVEITNGEDGVFFMLVRVVNIPLRNAIAHSTVTLDDENAQVIFSRIENGARVYEQIDLFQYMVEIYIHTRLPSIYLAALSTILVMETGRADEKLALPAVLQQAFTGVPVRT